MKQKILAVGLSMVMMFSTSTFALAENMSPDAEENSVTEMQTQYDSENSMENDVETEQAQNVLENDEEDTFWSGEDDGEQVTKLMATTTYISGDWTYTLSDSGATVTGYTGSSTTIEIPDSLDGYTVTEIGEKAFEGSDMTSVMIPESITTIGSCAFKNCTKLTDITINAKLLNNLSSMSSTGGHWCENASVFYNAGADSESLSVTFGNAVKCIPAYLFATGMDYDYGEGEYAHITSVVIADSVEDIGQYAFYNCYDLKSVTMGSGVQTIGGHAFQSSAIMQLTIPESVTEIGNCAFKNCTQLNYITINAENIEDMESSSNAAFYNAGSASNSLTVVFGSSVKSIPVNLFATSSDQSEGVYARVTSVVIPDNNLGKF